MVRLDLLIASLGFGLVANIQMGAKTAPVLLADLVAVGLAFAGIVSGSFTSSSWTVRSMLFMIPVLLWWVVSPMSLRWTLLGPILGMVLGLYAWAPNPAQRLRMRLQAARASALLAVVLAISLVLFGTKSQKDATRLTDIVQNGYDLPWARSNYVAAIIMLGGAGSVYLLSSRHKVDRLICTIALGACVPGLFLTGSRTQLIAWIAMIAGVYWCMVVNARKRARATAVLAIALLALLTVGSRYLDAIASSQGSGRTGYSTLDLRFTLWEVTIGRASTSMVGHNVLPVQAAGRSLLSHNAILQIWYSFGWLGLGLAVAIITTTIRTMRSAKSVAVSPRAKLGCSLDSVALGTMAMSGLAENTVFMHAYDLAFWPLFSLIVATASVSHARVD